MIRYIGDQAEYTEKQYRKDGSSYNMDSILAFLGAGGASRFRCVMAQDTEEEVRRTALSLVESRVCQAWDPGFLFAASPNVLAAKTFASLVGKLARSDGAAEEHEEECTADVTPRQAAAEEKTPPSGARDGDRLTAQVCSLDPLVLWRRVSRKGGVPSQVPPAQQKEAVRRRGATVWEKIKSHVALGGGGGGGGGDDVGEASRRVTRTTSSAASGGTANTFDADGALSRAEITALCLDVQRAWMVMCTRDNSDGDAAVGATASRFASKQMAASDFVVLMHLTREEAMYFFEIGAPSVPSAPTTYITRERGRSDPSDNESGSAPFLPNGEDAPMQFYGEAPVALPSSPSSSSLSSSSSSASAASAPPFKDSTCPVILHGALMRVSLAE